MNFDALGFTLSDGLVTSLLASIPLLVEPMSIDGRSGWRVVWDAVKRFIKGDR